MSRSHNADGVRLAVVDRHVPHTDGERDLAALACAPVEPFGIGGPTRPAGRFGRLQSVGATSLTRPAPVGFCSHCGRPPQDVGGRPSRICLHCEMGLLLEADPQLAPAPGDSFIVTDSRLLICALSQGAERLFRRSEPSVIHRPVSDLLVGVGEGEAGHPSLANLLRAAAAGTLEVTEAVVATVEGGREHHAARLGPCGPPTAALLIIDDAVA